MPIHRDYASTVIIVSVNSDSDSSTTSATTLKWTTRDVCRSMFAYLFIILFVQNTKKKNPSNPVYAT